jgi:two-component system sensor histidine kinase DesK
MFIVLEPTESSLICSREAYGVNQHGETRWLPIMMLIWSFWIFATPLVTPGDIFPHWLWPTIASFFTFLWLYFRAYYRDRSQLLWHALGIAALGFLITPVNPGANGYIIYACAFLAFCGGTRFVLQSMVALLLAYSAEWLLLGFPLIFLLNTAVLGIVVCVMNIMFARKHQRDAELKLSHDEVRRLAALAERERIGRDLHDLLGHTLSLITLKSELANRLWDRDLTAARREVIDVERVARDALAQVRRAITGIRAAGLVPEVAAAKLMLESSNVHFHYQLADCVLPAEIETVLAMAAREAVTNIQRHSHATQARLQLAINGGTVQLSITDNGRGGAIVPGNGLAGMRERLGLIGASLSIESSRATGTTLCVRLPLPPHTSMAQHGSPVMTQSAA